MSGVFLRVRVSRAASEIRISRPGSDPTAGSGRTDRFFSGIPKLESRWYTIPDTATTFVLKIDKGLIKRDSNQWIAVF